MRPIGSNRNARDAFLKKPVCQPTSEDWGRNVAGARVVMSALLRVTGFPAWTFALVRHPFC